MIAHPILFTLCFLVIWIAEGVLQGWIWADEMRRENNRWIKGGHKFRGQAWMVFHAWRLIEMGAIIGAIFGIVGISEQSALLIFGLSGIGWFVYERMLCRVNYGWWFPYKPDYLLWGLRIVRHPAQDMVVLLVAMVLLGILWQGR